MKPTASPKPLRVFVSLLTTALLISAAHAAPTQRSARQPETTPVAVGQTAGQKSAEELQKEIVEQPTAAIDSGAGPVEVVRPQSRRLQAVPSAVLPVQVTATAGTLGPTNYATLSDAFTAVNGGVHQGAITIAIVANTTEPGSAVLNSSG